MRVNVIELRDMIATAVRQTVAEAKKPKLAAPRSEESIEAERARRLVGLSGYAHGEVLDMSKPLGKRNRAKRQGASGMGNWTSEAKEPGMSAGKAMEIVKMMTANGVDKTTAMKLAPQILQKMGHGMVDPASSGLDDPSELGVDELPHPDQQREAVRHLIRRIVAEEIRVRR